jgi:pimeloyl-ACP methyl ester carboxylesterase
MNALGETGRAAGAHLLQVDGRSLQVYEEGTPVPGQPPVVLLTGAGDGTASWAAVRARLGGFARVVSYDRSGMGASGQGPVRSLAGYAAELHSVVSHSGAGKAVLVGHSLGGLIAQSYAVRHPGNVAGMVLLDATPDEIAGDPAVRAGFAVSAGMAAVLKALSPLGLVRFLLAARIMPLYPDQGIFRKQVDDARYREWITDVCRNFAGNAGPELRSVLDAARDAARARAADPAPADAALPVALVTSHAYGRKWVDMHHRLARRFADSRHTVLQDRSHNIHMRHPDVVAEAVREVIRRGTSS